MDAKRKESMSIMKKIMIAMATGILLGVVCLWLRESLTAGGNEGTWKLINRIREKDENTKIIILSGYSDFSFAQRAIELGVTRYLTKPTNARELIGILEEIEKNIQKPRSEEKQEMKVTNLFVQKAMDYISMNYSQKLTLTKISEQLCITPNYLSELFKKHTGQNVSEYIIDYRLEKACQFLKNPQLRIGEVSEKVGINDVRYFSSMFKKKYNLTPTEYRNKQ